MIERAMINLTYPSLTALLPYQMMIERAMEEANEEEKALREQEKIHHLSGD